jgi:eukaryotic-like serine/threonine-protein kinase
MTHPAGSRIGRYEVVGLLGTGGMGEVYLGRDTQLGREVAVKIVAVHATDDPLARARLVREAQNASILNHPHICTIHEVGETAEHAFFVMEHVEGRTLTTMIQIDGLLPDEAVRYGIQIAGALAHAHDHGVVHGDLKSANVIITPDGRAKVLDFGLARRVRAQTVEEVTRSQDRLMDLGVVAGTLPYMAPELLRGGTSDERSDIWALGVLLHEMAAGHRPFAGQTGLELSSAILREPPAPLPSRLPGTVVRIVGQCLAKDPGQRYQRASEVRAALEMSTPDPVAEARRSTAPSRVRPRVLAWTALTAAVLGAGFFVLSGPISRNPGPGAPFGNPTSLAILPLVNASGDDKAEYLSDGISDALINTLSQLPQLRVMARGTVFSYRDKEVDPRTLGRELDVQVVFSGRLTQRDDTTIVQADLANARDGTQIWGERYTRTMGDLPALQEGIAIDILEQLRLELTGEQQQRFTKRYTDNATAYRLFLEGRYHSNRLTIDGLKRGIELMNKAIELDPSYALAYAGLADAYADAAGVYLPASEAMPRVRAAAEHALRLDATLAEAHALLGYIKGTQDWQWTEAEQELQRTIALRPSYARAHEAYGHILMMQGRADDAIAAMTRARNLDPLSDLINANLGWFYYLARRYTEAVAWSQRLVGLDRNLVAGHYNLGMAYEQMGRHREAVAAFQEARNLDPTNWPTSALLCHGYASSGDRLRAKQLLLELTQQATRGSLDPVWIGLIHAALGDKERAFDWLEKAYQARSETLLFLKVDPKYDNLRSDPRFSELVKRLNLGGPEPGSGAFKRGPASSSSSIRP